MKPLEGLLVVDFSQFLSGPSASLRLADLGARVIKVERPDRGDLCREVYVSRCVIDGDSTLFHSINRHKESFAADLKNPEDQARIRKLLLHADVAIQNFRPGVMEKLGFDLQSIHSIHPRLVYGEITGYGTHGPWRDKPGQDLLVQALSGLPWLNGDAGQPPVPCGLPIADILTGAHLAQGILACLVRRGITGKGAKVEVSLLESSLDFQFEALTTYLNDGGQTPRRSSFGNAHAYLGAPYGIYATADGFLVLSIVSLPRLGEALSCPQLSAFADPQSLFNRRDKIKQIIADQLKQQSTAHWLSLLESANIWCADVYTWPKLFEQEGFQSLDMVQEVVRRPGVSLKTTRCPIRIDGEILRSSAGAPTVGQHTKEIIREFSL